MEPLNQRQMIVMDQWYEKHAEWLRNRKGSFKAMEQAHLDDSTWNKVKERMRDYNPDAGFEAQDLAGAIDEYVETLYEMETKCLKS